MTRWLPLTILMLWAGTVVLGPLLPLEPSRVALDALLQGPSPGLWLGADELGRPVLDRLVAGAQVSFLVAVSVVMLSGITGTLLGATAAYLGGRVDSILGRIVDVFLAFPGILLAIALSALLGPGVFNLVVALSLVGWVGYARLARAQVLSIRRRDHVLAAEALGAGRARIIFRHLIPLAFAPLMVEATFGVAAVIVAEAGLSFLGLGAQPPTASWGSMIREGSRYMLVAPHLVIAPGMAILLVVLAVNLTGDRLQDRFGRRTIRAGS
jgi:peptide/nickel transport system permease protein